jgi:hypothetical protein
MRKPFYIAPHPLLLSSGERGTVKGNTKYLWLAFTFLTLLFSSLLSGEARGDEFKLTPSLSLKEEYNDNIFITEKDRTKDFITTLSPGLELIDRTEKLDLNLLARIDVARYFDHHDLNHVDQNYRGSVSYLLNPRLKLSANAGYTRDFTPDRELEITGLVLTEIRRNRQNYGAGAEYTLTEKTKANLSYVYGRDDYAPNPSYVDTRSHDVILGLIHDLSQYFSNTAGRMNLGYSRYEFLDTTIDYYYTTVGMNRSISEKWSLLLDAGGSYASSDFVVKTLQFVPPSFVIVEKKETNQGWGWVGQGTLSYRGEKTTKGPKTTGDLTLSHRLMPAAGTVGVTERTVVSLSMAHYFTYELSAGLSAGYYINKAKRGKYSTGAIDEDVWRITPRIRYEFTKDISLEMSYNYSFVKDKLNETEAGRNLFMLSFTIKHSFFE